MFSKDSWRNHFLLSLNPTKGFGDEEPYRSNFFRKRNIVKSYKVKINLAKSVQEGSDLVISKNFL